MIFHLGTEFAKLETFVRSFVTAALVDLCSGLLGKLDDRGLILFSIISILTLNLLDTLYGRATITR
jgi:hypothetical protein